MKCTIEKIWESLPAAARTGAKIDQDKLKAYIGSQLVEAQRSKAETLLKSARDTVKRVELTPKELTELQAKSQKETLKKIDGSTAITGESEGKPVTGYEKKIKDALVKLSTVDTSKITDVKGKGLWVMRNGTPNFGNPFVTVNPKNSKPGDMLVKDNDTASAMYYIWLDEGIVPEGANVEALKARRKVILDNLDKVRDADKLYYAGTAKGSQINHVTALLKVTADRFKKDSVNIWAGNNENTELSNFASRPFTYRDVEFNSVEHAYQVWKSGKFNQSLHDKYGKNTGKITDSVKADNSSNVQLMKSLMLESFRQNEKALKALLATGDKELTHIGGKDPFWEAKFPELLMEVRKELKVKSPSGTQSAPTDTTILTPTERNKAYEDGLKKIAQNVLDKSTVVDASSMAQRKLDAAEKKAGHEVAGMYDPNDKMVYVRSKEVPGSFTKTHELLHAVTVDWMYANPKHELVKDLDKLFEHVKKEVLGNKDYPKMNNELPQGGIPYWAVSKEEFIAEVLAKPHLQNELKKVKYSTKHAKTAVGQFIQLLAEIWGSMFNMDKETALNELRGIVNSIVEEGKKPSEKGGVVQVEKEATQQVENVEFKRINDTFYVNEVTNYRKKFFKDDISKLSKQDKINKSVLNGLIRAITSKLSYESDMNNLEEMFGKYANIYTPKMKDLARRLHEFTKKTEQMNTMSEWKSMYHKYNSLQEELESAIIELGRSLGFSQWTKTVPVQAYDFGFSVQRLKDYDKALVVETGTKNRDSVVDDKQALAKDQKAQFQPKFGTIPGIKGKAKLDIKIC